MESAKSQKRTTIKEYKIKINKKKKRLKDLSHYIQYHVKITLITYNFSNAHEKTHKSKKNIYL